MWTWRNPVQYFEALTQFHALMPPGIIEEISTLQREHDLVIFVVAMQTHDQLNQARIYVCHLYKIYGSSSKCKNDVLWDISLAGLKGPAWTHVAVTTFYKLFHCQHVFVIIHLSAYMIYTQILHMHIYVNKSSVTGTTKPMLRFGLLLNVHTSVMIPN